VHSHRVPHARSNVRIDIRWGADDAERVRKSAAELVALASDVILTAGSPTTGPLLQATRTVPIVFVQVADPVGAGFVESLAQPGRGKRGSSAPPIMLQVRSPPLLPERSCLRHPQCRCSSP
jgi:ABC-type uncharacterized transport system substrate-binding protein